MKGFKLLIILCLFVVANQELLPRGMRSRLTDYGSSRWTKKINMTLQDENWGHGNRCCSFQICFSFYFPWRHCTPQKQHGTYCMQYVWNYGYHVVWADRPKPAKNPLIPLLYFEVFNQACRNEFPVCEYIDPRKLLLALIISVPTNSLSQNRL